MPYTVSLDLTRPETLALTQVDAERWANVWGIHAIVWECACTDGTNLSATVTLS